MPEAPPLVPPPDLAICFGGGDFQKAGNQLKTQLIERLGLLPHERVLDVGCGIGRAAIPLTSYLTSGRYEGFDTFPLGVEWASKNITPRFPRFNFRTVDVFNRTYNPFSAVKARDFRFPFPDASFDLVILNSVFTHMFPEDVHGYLREIFRALDAGGRSYITWYLMDAAAREALKQGGVEPNFKHKFGGFYVENLAEPEDAVAFDAGFATNLYLQNGFEIREIRHGGWKRTPGAETGQDRVYAWKRETV